VAEAPDPRPVPGDPRITADHLAVRWPGAQREAVSDVTFVLDRGRRMVLAGPSGSGKSTVLAALLRTLSSARGTVRLDGVDTSGMASEEVRDRIGWSGAAAHLFDSTLRENLRLARPQATDDELVDALRRARLAGWLAQLPEGLDTALGEHGGPVSGGERQRLAVARVLLADRPVMALDEPTAHLDTATAIELAAEIEEVGRGRTAIVVTHRPGEFPSLPVLDLGEGADRRSSAAVGETGGFP
jgi:ATP-binding cassette subfamily C protein CydCD